jgi:hypothetical protein
MVLLPALLLIIQQAIKREADCSSTTSAWLRRQRPEGMVGDVAPVTEARQHRRHLRSFAGDSSLLAIAAPRAQLRVSSSTQGVGGGRVFQSGGDAEEGRAPPLMLFFAEHEARQ